ncbi:MAG: hypothetical protein LCH84_02600 [Gemmatimonadetes bacterium]|nr:hypothetical protein [Gemmatimonadota bacterium]
MIDLDGVAMYVSSTDASGVVGAETQLWFRQRAARVWATYGGGGVQRGWLVGRWQGAHLHFRYVQREAGGAIHAGVSHCTAERGANGRVRLFEHFAWTTRAQQGVNVFDELPRARHTPDAGDAT